MAKFDWTSIKPGTGTDTNLDLANAERVPADVLAQYVSSKGLGRTVKKQTAGRYCVRTGTLTMAERFANIEVGTLYLVPVFDPSLNITKRKRTSK